MGTSTSVTLFYGFLLTWDDLMKALGYPEYDDDQDYDEWEALAEEWEEKFNDEDGMYGWAERFGKRYGLLDTDSYGDMPDWDETSMLYSIHVKSCVVTDYDPAFRIELGWLTESSHEESNQLHQAAKQLNITSAPGWHVGWSRF